VEIEVDPDTGGIEIIKQVSVNDAGKVINPDAFNGQQYGGAYMDSHSTTT
jgi:CO/xanthine dehydrogenase Mo-binding subunit